MKTYTIEIWSRGLDVGIGKITKDQFEYWDDEGSMWLSDALNDNFDYEENEAPEGAKLDKEYYNEYSDVLYSFGADIDNHTMKITDSDGEVVYEGDVSDLVSEYDPECELDMRTSGDADYYKWCHEPGYYVQWMQGGKGQYFDGDFEAEEFDPLKLKFHVKETDYGEILDGISYAGEELSNNAGDYDIKSFDCEVFVVQEKSAMQTAKFDYNKIDKVLQFIMDNRMYDVDNLEVGEDISDCSGIKVIFDNYGDLDDEETGEYTEHGNKNMESYAIFIHKDSATDDFEFPPHATTPWALIHRPDEELCVYGWHDVKEDSWDFTMIEDTSTNLSPEVIIKLFDDLYEMYNLDEGDADISVSNNPAAWPFPS